MADPKSIHEFLPTSGNIGSLFLVDDPDSQATSGYTTRQVSMDDVGEMVNNGIDYTQDLDTEDKKVIGAINELHGVDGYDVYDETRTSSNKYVQGDICIHSNSLQVCTDADGAHGAWDSTKWSPTTIKALLALKQNSSDLSLNTTNKTVVGAINELNYLSDIKRIEVQAEHQTCAAGQTVVVNYTVSVPTGYKIIGAWDQSYWAGVLGVPIIATDSGSVSFNYFSTGGFSDRLLRAMVVLAKNVNR